MKNIILCLLVMAGSSLLYAQSSRSLNAFNKLNFAEKPFTVTGTFVGYDQAVDSFHLCKVIYNHLYKNEQQTHIGEIDKAGKFSITFPLNRPQEIMFNFGDELVVFYAVPGTSLDIQLDLAGFKELSKLEYVEQLKQREPMTFTGTYAQLNKELNAFRPNLQSIMNYKTHYPMIDSLDQMDYKKYRLEKMDNMLQALTSFNNSNNTSSEFRQVMTQFIRYNAAEDLFRYRWMHGVVKTKRPPVRLTSEYLSFLNDMPVNNEEAVITETYSGFLREYAHFHPVGGLYMPAHSDTTRFITFLRQKGKAISPAEEAALTTAGSQRTPAQKQLADTFYKSHTDDRNEFNSGLFFYKSIDTVVANTPPGTGLDLLYARLVAERLNRERATFSDDELNQLLSHVANPNIRTQVQRDNNRLRDVLAGKMPNTTRVRTALQVSSDKFFDELMKPYKGKVVYIDFWAPWCGPCMGEMPESKELQKELAGKDVVFLYIGISCTKQSWENTIKDKAIGGEHYFANDNDGKLLSQKFNIAGIPHYALVDKTGKVVDDHTLRPSDKSKLLRKINGLLK